MSKTKRNRSNRTPLLMPQSAVLMYACVAAIFILAVVPVVTSSHASTEGLRANQPLQLVRRGIQLLQHGQDHNHTISMRRHTVASTLLSLQERIALLERAVINQQVQGDTKISVTCEQSKQAAAPPVVQAQPSPVITASGKTTCITGSVEAVAIVNTRSVVATHVQLYGHQQYMVLPKNDEYVTADILRSRQPFQSELLRIMLKFVREGSTALDVGGNLGTYSMWFAKEVGPKGTVWAFEPQNMIFQIMCTNMVINGHRNVKTLNMALSFKEGIAHMSDSMRDGTLGGQNYSAHEGDVSKKINYGGRNLGEGGEGVRMVPLDSLNIQNVSFIKIDVQGAEALVIYGARETIKRELPVVNFEIGSQFSITPAMIRDMQIPSEVVNFDIAAFLRSLNYRLLDIWSEDQFWVPEGYKGPGGDWATGALSLAEMRARKAELKKQLAAQKAKSTKPRR